MNFSESLVATNYFFHQQKSFYRGKVRDVYDIDNTYLAVVACDRISAFDHVLPKPIPYKGQVLNQIAAHFLEATKDICPNWLIATPDPNVSIGLFCEPFKIEMVIRGYLAGHAWREYSLGKREICGVALPDGLKENDALPYPIITPTIKATKGHDTDISREDILKQGVVSEEDYLKLEYYTQALYQRGVEMAAAQQLILVDTKYEFGKKDGQIYLIDEVHTPDSSRYFYKEEYDVKQKKGIAQEQLSKEFVRQWLIQNGFQGLEGQKIPAMTDEFIISVTDRYIELYQKITGKVFLKEPYEGIQQRIEENINIWIKSKGLY
jgi:phosphoribosylaminoimidazole-succinocarboxamide synthase